MSDDHPEFIIVKRRSSHEEEHHGGAWKIAFADFMTAMMAFFLVLWIINATDKNTKTIIARYFNPVKIEEPARAAKGIRNKNGDPSSTKEESTGPSPSETSGPAQGGQTPAKENKKDQHAAAKEAAAAAKVENQAADKHDAHKPKKEPPPATREGRPDAAQGTAAAEFALFNDPYATLDRISGETTPLRISDGARRSTALRDDATPFQDPFRPPALADEDPPEAKPADTADAQRPKAESQGERAAPETKPAEHPVDVRKAEKAEPLIRDINARIAALNLAQLPNVEVKASSEGILVSLTDNLQFSMFAVGSAEPRPEALKAVNAIASALQKTQGRLVVRGYTDGRPYRSKVYDNWRLSSARAQMTYYMLTRAGLPEGRFERVEGYADKKLRVPIDPLDPRNRRIEILLSTQE